MINYYIGDYNIVVLVVAVAVVIVNATWIARLVITKLLM